MLTKYHKDQLLLEIFIAFEAFAGKPLRTLEIARVLDDTDFESLQKIMGKLAEEAKKHRSEAEDPALATALDALERSLDKGSRSVKAAFESTTDL